MQVENQISRSQVSPFPWVNVLKKKLLTSFPEIEAETLVVLNGNISEEFERLLEKPNKSRARTFYRVLRELYLHFCWKINWNEECHLKSTCVQIFYYLCHLGLILSKGDVFSGWFSQVLTVLKCLPGDPFVICDALLLMRNVKRKYYHAYSEILKSLLFDISMNKPPNAECFVKAMLLFRRLKFLSKGAAAKCEITFYASKIKCPADVESWLSSLNIKGLHNIKCSKVTRKFLKKNLSCDAVQKLLKVLFANKYDEKRINSCRFQAAKMQHNVIDNKQVKKKFDKKHEIEKDKPNAQFNKLDMTLNDETIPQVQHKNSFKKIINIISLLNNTLEENSVTISSELQNEERNMGVEQTDYHYFSSTVTNFNEKNSVYVSSSSGNSTALTKKSKRKFLETEHESKTFLDDSTPVSLALKKRKIFNKGNSELEESNPKHSSLQDVNTSEQSVTDRMNELTGKWETVTSTLNVNGKSVSKETVRLIHNETQNQFISCSSKMEDLQKNHVKIISEDSKAITSKILESKNSKKNLRKKVKSKKSIESRSADDDQNVSKDETSKTTNNSNCVVTRFCDALSSKINPESFQSGNSVSFRTNKDERVINKMKHSTNYSEKQKKDLSSESELSNNHVVVAEQTKLARSIKKKNWRLSPEQFNISSSSAVSESLPKPGYVSDKSSEIQSFNVYSSKEIVSDSPSCSQKKQTSQDSENCIVSTSFNNLQTSLNNSSSFLTNQESFSELQKSKQAIKVKEAQIVLYDCLATQNYSVSSSKKNITQNLVCPKKDTSISVYSTTRQKKSGKQKNIKCVLDSDSDTFDDQRGLYVECTSESKLHDSLNSSKSSSVQSKLSHKVKYKRCFIESSSDTSVDQSELHNNSNASQCCSLQETSFNTENPPKIVSESEEDSVSKAYLSRCPSRLLRCSKKVKTKDFVLESTSEGNSDNDNSDHSSKRQSPELISPNEVKSKSCIVESASEDNSDHLEYSSRSSSHKVNPRDFFLGFASEDNGDYSECSSKSLSSVSKTSNEVTHENFLLNSTPEDNFYYDDSEHLSRSPSPESRSSKKDKSKNLISETAYGDNTKNSVLSSRSPTPEVRPSNKEKLKISVLESSSEDVANNSVSSSRSSSPELRTSNKVIASHVNFDYFSHALKTSSPIKVTQNFSNLHNSKENISDFPANLQDKETSPNSENNDVSKRFSNSKYLLRSSAHSKTKKASFPEFKKSEQAGEFQEVQVILHDCLSDKNSSLSLSPRKLTQNVAIEETDTSCLVSSKRKLKKRRRISTNFVLNSESYSFENQSASKSKLDGSLNSCRSSSFQFKSSNKVKHKKCLVDSNNFASADQNAVCEKSTAPHNNLVHSSESSFLERNSIQINHKQEFLSEDSKIQKYILNKSPNSLKEPDNLGLSETDKGLSINQPLSDSNEKNDGLISSNIQHNCVLRESSFESGSDSSENIPLLKLQKKLKSSFNSSVLSQNSVPSLNLGKLSLKKATDCIQKCGSDSYLSENLPASESPKSVKRQENQLDLSKTKEQHLCKDSLLDSNYLCDESFVQTILDKIDPNILANEDYLNSFVDNYLISSSTHNALNGNVDISDHLKTQVCNENSSLMKTVTPYTNTVNKSSQQKSEFISNPSNTDTFDLHKIKENLMSIESKTDCDALDFRNAHKNVCLNSNLDRHQTIDGNNSQQLSTQCLDSSDNGESQHLDLDIVCEKGINSTQNSDSVHNIVCLDKTSKLSTQYEENCKNLEPFFCEMDFEEASPDRTDTSLNSESLLKDLQPDVGHTSEMNCSNPLNDSCAETALNAEGKSPVKQSNLNNSTDGSEKILFVCDVEKKTCNVHIMPQHSLVAFLNKFGNVSEKQTQCSNNTQCHCPLCSYLSPISVDSNEELSKNDTDLSTGTHMGHICVNGIKLSTASIFPVVYLGKRCDETEAGLNNNVYQESIISSSNKVLAKKELNTKGQCFLKSNSENIAAENHHRKVFKTRKSNLNKKKNDSTEAKNKSTPQRSYSLRCRSRLKCYDENDYQT